VWRAGSEGSGGEEGTRGWSGTGGEHRRARGGSRDRARGAGHARGEKGESPAHADRDKRGLRRHVPRSGRAKTFEVAKWVTREMTIPKVLRPGAMDRRDLG
jgi:hypothetical protein